MVQIKIQTNTTRRTIAVDENHTIREVLDNNDVNYSTATVFLDGTPLSAGQHDKSFKDLGITEKCLLSAVVKTENA